MVKPLRTVAIIPLAMAGLCPQCSCICNSAKCPICHSQTLVLWRIIDRAIQVHGALGYSTDTPLAHMLQQARWSRFADGADEIHQMRIAQRTIAAYRPRDTLFTNT